jgi:hypothetical protein
VTTKKRKRGKQRGIAPERFEQLSLYKQLDDEGAHNTRYTHLLWRRKKDWKDGKGEQ